MSSCDTLIGPLASAGKQSYIRRVAHAIWNLHRLVRIFGNLPRLSQEKTSCAMMYEQYTHRNPGTTSKLPESGRRRLQEDSRSERAAEAPGAAGTHVGAARTGVAAFNPL